MDAQGALNTVFGAANPSLAIRDRLRITILNPSGFPPQGNTKPLDENGIWNAVVDPVTRTLRVSVV